MDIRQFMKRKSVSIAQM